MNLFCFVMFSARSGGRGGATLLSTPFCANPPLPTLRCQPCFANPALPTLLCQPCFANPAVPTLLCQPCFANPALPTLLCQPCFANPALRTLCSLSSPSVGCGTQQKGPTKTKTKVLGQLGCQPFANPLPTLCQPFANPVANPKNRSFL